MTGKWKIFNQNFPKKVPNKKENIPTRKRKYSNQKKGKYIFQFVNKQIFPLEKGMTEEQQLQEETKE